MPRPNLKPRQPTKADQLTKADITMLEWCIEQARQWRGSLTDSAAREEHDDAIATAKVALQKVRVMRNRVLAEQREANAYAKRLNAMMTGKHVEP